MGNFTDPKIPSRVTFDQTSDKTEIYLDGKKVGTPSVAREIGEALIAAADTYPLADLMPPDPSDLQAW